MEIISSLDSRIITSPNISCSFERESTHMNIYMDDWDKFKETVLPPKEAFYSKLAMAGVSEEDYEHTRRVWAEFGLSLGLRI